MYQPRSTQWWWLAEGYGMCPDDDYDDDGDYDDNGIMTMMMMIIMIMMIMMMMMMMMMMMIMTVIVLYIYICIYIYVWLLRICKIKTECKPPCIHHDIASVLVFLFMFYSMVAFRSDDLAQFANVRIEILGEMIEIAYRSKNVNTRSVSLNDHPIPWRIYASSMTSNALIIWFHPCRTVNCVKAK